MSARLLIFLVDTRQPVGYHRHGEPPHSSEDARMSMISRRRRARCVLFLLAAFATTMLPAAAQPAVRRPAAGTPHVSTAERIRRIESGDLVALGPHRPPLRLDLARLMSVFHVPGLSIAVIDGSQIAWAKGYGVTESGKTTRVTTHTLFQADPYRRPSRRRARWRSSSAARSRSTTTSTRSSPRGSCPRTNSPRTRR